MRVKQLASRLTLLLVWLLVSQSVVWSLCCPLAWRLRFRWHSWELHQGDRLLQLLLLLVMKMTAAESRLRRILRGGRKTLLCELPRECWSRGVWKGFSVGLGVGDRAGNSVGFCDGAWEGFWASVKATVSWWLSWWLLRRRLWCWWLSWWLLWRRFNHLPQS